LAKFVGKKFHKNRSYGRRGKTDEVMELVLATLSANGPKKMGSVNEI